MTKNEFYRVENRGDRVRLVTRDWTAKLVHRSRDLPTSRYYAKTRVYDAIDAFAATELSAYQDALTANNDTAARQLRRSMIARTRAALSEALPTLVPYVDVNFSDRVEEVTFPNEDSITKFIFSDKAGCSCGCSPGFILDDDSLRVNGTVVDVWFSARYEDSLTATERRETERAKRDALVITRKDLAQAVFYGLTELDRIKQELGV